MNFAATLSLISAVTFIATTAFAEEPPLQDGSGKGLQANVDWGFAAYTGHAGQQTYLDSGISDELFACDVRQGACSAWPVLIGRPKQCPRNTRSQCRLPSLPEFAATVAFALKQCRLKITRPLTCSSRWQELDRPQPQRVMQCFVVPHTS